MTVTLRAESNQVSGTRTLGTSTTSAGDTRSFYDQLETLLIGPDQYLSCEAIEGVTRQEEPRIRLSEKVQTRLFSSIIESEWNVPETESVSQTGEWLRSLAAGWSPARAPEVAPSVVRAAMLLQVHYILRGRSGIRPDVVRAYLHLLEAQIVPCVPLVGATGSKGDRIPLAHIARVLCGEGMVQYRGHHMKAADALHWAEITPILLNCCEAQALVSGASLQAALAAHTATRTSRLLAWAVRLTDWLMRTQEVDASEPEGSLTEDARALHACLEDARLALRLIEGDINGSNNDPAFSEDIDPGQPGAFAADSLNAALTRAALVAERQVAMLLSPSETGSESAELHPSSEQEGAAITLTALVAEMRDHAPRKGMTGPLAARKAYDQTERLAAVLAVTGRVIEHFAGAHAAPPAEWPDKEARRGKWSLHEDIGHLSATLLFA